MLSEEERARVSVVLVRARNPNNIGAVARAMHGFGFSDLRLVNDYSVGLETARSAVDASAILADAKQFAGGRRGRGGLQPGGGHDRGRRTQSWSIRCTRWRRAAAWCTLHWRRRGWPYSSDRKRPA